MPSIGTILILFLGILLGGILFNKTFRVKFFKGLRHFLAGLSRGAQQQGDRSKGKVTRNPHPDVEHRYIHTHHPIKCTNCDGTGRVEKKLPAMIDENLIKERTMECPECEGTGKVYD